jgi:hypothetical protein
MLAGDVTSRRVCVHVTNIPEGTTALGSSILLSLGHPNEVEVDRGYPVKPSTDTDSFVGFDYVRESPNLTVRISHKTEDQSFYTPFPNPTIFRLIS